MVFTRVTGFHFTRRFLMDLIPFAYRQFDDPNYAGTKIVGTTKEEFVKKLTEEFKANPTLADGYAPFCKHFFVKNFTPSQVGTIEITPENENKLKTGYAARTEKELAVLERWFPKESVELPVAKYLDIILYSRAQVIEECKEMNEEFTLGDDIEWGIVAIKAQDEDYETPMTPITMLRNALGKSEGGSGVPLEREKYLQSVKYWSTRATTK